MAETALDLPSYQRLSGFALTDRSLPRTRLGKYRRFLLHDLYTSALAGGPQRTAWMLDEADMALLREPMAGAVWALLRERFPDRAIDLDVDPSLDLNLDSFAWMELEVAPEARAGVRLTEADIAGIERLRDLLRRCVARRAGGVGIEEAPALARDTQRWLAPRGLLLTAAGLVMYGLELGGHALLLSAARLWAGAPPGKRRLCDYPEPCQRPRRNGDCRGFAAVASTACVLGGRHHSAVL